MTTDDKIQALNDYKARDAELKEEKRRSEMSFMDKVTEDYVVPAAEYGIDKYDRYQAGEDPVELFIETMNDMGDIKYIGKLPGMIGGAADIGAGVAQGDWDRVTKGAGNIVTSGIKTKKKGMDATVKELKNPQLAEMQSGGSARSVFCSSCNKSYYPCPPTRTDAECCKAACGGKKTILKDTIKEMGGRTEQLRGRQYDDIDTTIDLDESTINELMALGAEIEYL
jgi:hypothetical protein